MVNYFIYAKDVSYSADGEVYHRNMGRNTVEEFKEEVEELKENMKEEDFSTDSKIIYLNWWDDCWEVSEEDVRATYINRATEYSGIRPAIVVRYLIDRYITDKNDKIKLLYIVMDGLIDEESKEECFKFSKDLRYRIFFFHSVHTVLRETDDSAAMSFYKSVCLTYRDIKFCDSVIMCEEYDYDKITGHNFPTEIDQLKSYIKLKFFGKNVQYTSTSTELDKLKKLRGRLFDELSSKREKNKVNLETKDRNVLMREFINTDWYKNLGRAVYYGKVEIEKCISSLINYIVSDTKTYLFDISKFDKEFDKSIEEEQMVDDVQFTVEQEIEFPDIILEDEKGIPVVILMKFNLMKKIIFHETQECSDKVKPASFSKFKSIMECPLFLMNDQDVSESIGYFYTLNVYKQFLANNTNKEPRTRRQFHGGLVLTDTDQFDKYNDYILSATYFDFKKINYNVGLFYFVLWKNCENKEWMDRNVVEQFKKYTMRRISKTVCKIGLSSLPLDPQENTSLLTSLWYCVDLSSFIFKNDVENFKHERLRMYHSVAPYMIEILKYFNYDLDLGSIEKRIELISHVMILKKIPKHREKVYYLLKSIFKTVDGFLVSEIEKPFNLYKVNYLKLNHKSILRDDVIEEKVNLNEYVHLMHFVGDLDSSKVSESTYEICEKTFRPYFAIDQNKSFYTELVKNTRKVIITINKKNKVKVTYEAIDSLEFDRILSLYKMFIDCVSDLQKYPTLSEYVEFISKKKKFDEDLVTIFPSNVYLDIKGVYQRYENIIKKVTVDEFIEISKRYIRRNDRVKAEERVKFQSDDEISKFISSEELKVSLIKKHTQLHAESLAGYEETTERHEILFLLIKTRHIMKKT